MTANVLKHRMASRQVSLRDAYRGGISESWNTLINVGRIDYASVRTMTGYLSAAAGSLRVTGDEPVAHLMETAAMRLLADWRDFEPCITQLVADLDALD